ncbi:MAG: DUF600 family protein [Caldilineaceae bacterium]|nr:DUF600 family protein [Caldilineaceae bacterium]
MDSIDFSNATLEAIYQAIGNYIAHAIQEEWQSAILFVEIDDDESGLLYGRYITKTSQDYSLSFDTDYILYLAFNELRQRIQKPGYAAWTKASFTLHRNGKFDIDFKYPD